MISIILLNNVVAYVIRFILFGFCVKATYGNNFNSTDYSEYIVQFTRFISYDERLIIIKFSLQFFIESWFFVPRPYMVLFSDFENIKIADNKFKDISVQLYSYKVVKSIYLNTQIFGRKLNFFSRHKTNGHKMASHLQADLLWSLGIRGQGVRVGIFDTGIDEDHSHFRHANIIEYTNWTNEPHNKDTIGHGTFVAGMFVSEPDDDECPRGISPDVDLYIFRLFTKKQMSYTSWFLDAFNYAMARRIHLINLSIGGPDFHDLPFVHKVWDLSASGILMISAIGNDGPLYGTLNNPADQLDVIGVGGLDFDDKMTTFSSRGMTTWELPSGYGRVKPDVVTYGSKIVSTSLGGSCRTLSGTSVASPSVAAVVALLICAATLRNSSEPAPNPGIIKQAVLSSASRLPASDANIFEQGMGKLNLIGAYRALLESRLQVSAYPSYIDLTEHPYMWPYSAQPLYASAMPIIVNVTVINSISMSSIIIGYPVYHAILAHNGDKVSVSISHSKILWPWTGYIAVELTVKNQYSNWEGITEGYIMTVIESWDSHKGVSSTHLKIPIRTRIVPTPPRRMRILWDQFHNLRYPPGYIPRDNIRRPEPLDWTGDHIHTNFKDSYDHLRSNGYFIEVLGSHFGCFDASNYGTLVIVDPEEEFFSEERTKLWDDVTHKGLSLIVIAEWYNVDLMRHIKFFDENTRQWWTPDTGGANIPALNGLLSMFNIGFSSKVLEGTMQIGNQVVQYNSGTSLSLFPDSDTHISRVYYARKLKDVAAELVKGLSSYVDNAPVLGLYSGPKGNRTGHGRVAVFGDSNCLDMTFRGKDCLWLWDSLLQFTRTGHISEPLASRVSTVTAARIIDKYSIVPVRYQKNRLHRFSAVIKSQKDGHFVYRVRPACARDTTSAVVMDTSSIPDRTWFMPQVLLKRDPKLSVDIGFKNYAPHKSVNLDKPRYPSVVRAQVSDDEAVSPNIYWLYLVCVISCSGVVLYWLCRRIRPRMREIRPVIPTYKYRSSRP